MWDIQDAIDQARVTVGGAGSSAIVDIPGGVYTISAALLLYAGVHLRGVGAHHGTVLRADPAGDFTNGSRSAFSSLLKWDGGDVWAHGVRVTGIRFDTGGVPGLGAAWFQEAGEGFLLDDVACDGTAASSRTVDDAQVRLGSNVVVFTASTVTEEDVNALVHAGAAFFPAGTKIDRVNYAYDQAYPPQIAAKSIALSNAATASGSDVAFTIDRPTDAFTVGGGATGRLGFIKGVDNSGALVRIKSTVGSVGRGSGFVGSGFGGGTWRVGTLSGDGNGGGLLRVSRMGTSADPASVVVGQFKAENNAYNPKHAYAMDPVLLLDRCAAMQLDVFGGTFFTTGGRDIVRIDQPQKRFQPGNGPSIHLHGVEGANPFNPQYANIVRDSSTGEAKASTPFGAAPYPDVLWNRVLWSNGPIQGTNLSR